MTRKNIPSTQSGYTLIEIGIVLVIIGILIAGVLRGQELIKNAAINANIQQMASMEQAFQTFKKTYGSLPGDFAAAGARLRGCATVTNCSNIGPYMGDGIISERAGPVDGISTPYPIHGENYQAWQHLAAAELFTSVNTNGVMDYRQWGVSYPAAKSGGGYQINYWNIPSGTSMGKSFPDGVQGHFFILRGQPTEWGTTTTVQQLGDPVGRHEFTPAQAAQLDTKIDDGISNTGRVIGVGIEIFVGTSNDCMNGFYNQTLRRRQCNLLVKLRGL